jgi:EmrB/QacA subfamily drug resistance transporter
MTSMLSSLTAPGDRRRWIALAVVCLAQLMTVLDTTIVNVALPAIQRDLHFTQTNLTWVVDAFLIAFGSFLLLAGRAGDLVGRRRVFLAGLAVFTAASALCGLAPDQWTLIAARFIQGFGAALATSAVLAIIVTEFPEPADRAKAMSAFVFVAVAGGSLGLLAGGILTQTLSWRWIFFVNLPIGVAAFILGRILVPADRGSGIEDGVDWLGSLLVTAAMLIGVYSIVEVTRDGWGSPQVLGGGALALALLGAFAALEARIANPIMPLQILRLRTLVASSVVRGLLVTGMYGTFFLGTLYLEHVRHYGALATGAAYLPWTLTVAALSLGVTARLVARLGALAVLLGGLATMTVGLLLLSTVGAHTSFMPTIFLAYFAIGLGTGSSFMPLLTIAMSKVPAGEAGLASGIVNVSQQVSGALGLALLGTFAASRTKALAAAGHSPVSAVIGGYHLAFLIAAGCTIVGILVAYALLRTPARPAAAVVEHPAMRDPRAASMADAA